MHVLLARCLLIHSLSRTPSDAVQRGADSSSSVALQGSVVSPDDELGCPGSSWESSFISSVLITFLLYNTWETNLQKRGFVLLLFPEGSVRGHLTQCVWVRHDGSGSVWTRYNLKRYPIHLLIQLGSTP